MQGELKDIEFLCSFLERAIDCDEPSSVPFLQEGGGRSQVGAGLYVARTDR